jgi:general L-amino acid transport system permease protein
MSMSFVRDKMLPQKAPPITEQGAVKWMRENLFSSWLNAILTVLAIVALYYLIQGSLPWWLHSVWDANSLGECREAIAAKWGEDQSGACWAMIRERWHQFFFGFYPSEEYWRPVTTFALMFVALAPVLYFGLRVPNTIMTGVVSLLLLVALWAMGTDSKHMIIVGVIMVHLVAFAWVAPKKLLLVTALFPAIMFFLLWGGSVWAPINTLLGFGVLVLAMKLLQPHFGVFLTVALGVANAVVWWLLIQSDVTALMHGAFPIGLSKIDSDQFGGFLLAFVIGVSAISASLPLGILLALGRKSDMLLIKSLCVGFIEFCRGVPLITMLFTASLLLQYFLPRGTNFDLILRVVILVTLFSAAYIAEVVRGGLAALPRGQYEAADALGLDYWQAHRLIIMPQALKISIPGIVSSFIGLFKDTVLVAFVGLADPLKGITAIVRADINWKGIYWEPYIFVGAIFFIFCFGMSRYSMYLENKLKRDHR